MKSKITRNFFLSFAIALLIFAFTASILFVIILGEYRTKVLQNELQTLVTNTARYLSLEMERLQEEGHNDQSYWENIKDSRTLHLMAEIVNEKMLLLGINTDYAIVFDAQSSIFLPRDEIKNIARVLDIFNGETVLMKYFDQDVSKRVMSIGVPVYSSSNSTQIIAALVMRSSNISNLEINEQPIVLILFSSLAVALILAVGTSIILSRRLSLPLRKIELATYQLADGNYQIRTQVIQNDEVGSLASHIDILAERLHQASLKSMELEHMREEFISNISHELRTPVAVICNSVEAIYDGVVSDAKKTKQYCEQILKESTHMQRMVDDLFDLSCLQNDSYTIKKETLNLVEVVDDAVRSADLLALQKDINIEYQKNFEEQDFSGDYDRLYQMIMAVLNNAVKFSPNGQKIEIKLIKEETEAILSITDYGKDIKPEHLSHIFDRFYKTNEEGGGTGLGMPIAKAIAERHGIEILVSSKDECTTFSFVFPLS